ncbi:hypothetical protein D770_05205 [Flammeovirgaceae bacterium 311]|nr:hypothetical protein D770_05205 [Flammeovirgaceae bacterium 311]
MELLEVEFYRAVDINGNPTSVEAFETVIKRGWTEIIGEEVSASKLSELGIIFIGEGSGWTNDQQAILRIAKYFYRDNKYTSFRYELLESIPELADLLECEKRRKMFYKTMRQKSKAKGAKLYQAITRADDDLEPVVVPLDASSIIIKDIQSKNFVHFV